MLLDGKRKEALNAFFQHISPQNSKDKAAKSGQILAYLEIIHAQLRKYSTKRPLVCIECGAGNAYLSFYEPEGEYVRMCDAFHVTPPLDKYLQIKRN